MKNLILENFDKLKNSNYVRKTDPKNKYWGDFSHNKMEKFKEETGGVFNLIIHGDPNVFDDYYVIPYNIVKDIFTEQSFSRDKDAVTRKRWIFTIENHKMKVSNSSEILDIKDYYAVPINDNPQTEVLNPSYDYKKIIKAFNNIIGTSDYFQQYITALTSKPFVIITGNSGTGKTRIAAILGKWLGRETISGPEKNQGLFKGKLITNGFYWQIAPYYLKNNRIDFNQNVTENFFKIPEYNEPDDVKVYLDDKSYQFRLRKNTDNDLNTVQITGLKEIHDWLNSVGVGNFFKITLLPEEDGFSNVLRFEKVYENLEIEKSIHRYSIVPVGADWTDNRNILGYYNSIKELYQTTPVLDIVLDAESNPDKPFFLILDEMNLSHIERYFSDFLSVLESGEDIVLHSESEAVFSSAGRKIPNRLSFPKNLFITGTVNIDETTYMFSPKVLDRANVLEFSIREDDIRRFFNGHKELEIPEADDEIKEAFLDLSLKVRDKEQNYFSLDSNSSERIQSAILDLFKILKTFDMEFAYRTIDEILRYARSGAQLNENWNWEQCMDEQILQKILPKLHGSRKKLEKPLFLLLHYSHSADLEQVMAKIDSPTELKFPGEHKYKNSFSKLEKMIKYLKQDGFVSFIQ